MTGATFGRDTEWAAIRRTLADTAAGAGGSLVLQGPAGIGKSHLLRAAARAAREEQIAVAAREAFTLDLAAPLVTLAGALRALSPAGPEFAWLAGRAGPGNQYQTLERLRESLENAAARSPLLIIIDDAHWMDELSALAVRELVPALASSPVRWFFGCRPPAEQTPGRQTLNWLARTGAERITLGMLDDAATTRLCAQVVGAEVDDTVLPLARGCGGNPLRIERLMTALQVTGQLVISDGVATVTGSELPSSFIHTVQDVLASLSPAAQLLVKASSVFARPFGISAAARLIEHRPAELIPLVDEATGDFLTDRTDGLTFAHDLVRQAVYSTLGNAVREQLHHDAALVSREEHRPALEVAEHLQLSGHSGAAEAAVLLRGAAREVAAAAPATAATLMLKALEAGTGPERPAMIAEAVGLLASAARLGEARELGEEALRAGLGGETDALLLLGLAEAAKHLGQNQGAADYAERGLAQHAVSTATQSRLHAIRAHALVYVDTMLAAADASGARSDELGRASGEFGAAVFGLTARSLVAHAEGRLDDALSHAERATQLADRSGPAALHRHPRIWLASALSTLDRFDEAQAVLEQGRRESDRLGTAWAQPLFHYYYAGLLMAQGRLEQAVTEADAGVSRAEELTASQLAVPLLGVLIRLAVLRGESDQAYQHRAKMRRLIDSGITAPPEDVEWAEAMLLHAGGATGAAVSLLSGLYDELPSRPALLAVDPGAAAVLVSMALTAGDQSRAQRAAEAARLLAVRNPGSLSAGAAAAHAQGLLRRDPAQLRAAVEQFRKTRRPLALAAALEDAAEVGARTEPAHLVQSWSEEALTIVADCGATSAQDRLTARLGRRPGRRPVPRPQPTCLPELSDAERPVALAVGQGLTNIEVAAQLYLSRHTVDSHLRKIFRKLGINRRVELAAVVARQCPGGLGRT